MIDAIPSNEAKGGVAVIPFEAYEELCNPMSHTARKNGFFVKDIYDEAVADASTVITSVNGRKAPVLVDMQYGLGLGYDQERARQYADNQPNVSILALPIGDLNDKAQEAILDAVAQAGTRSIYFSDNGFDGDVLIKGLAERGVDFSEHPLLDKRAKSEFEQSSLSFYELDVLHKNHEKESKRSLADVSRHFAEVTLPAIEDPNNDVILRSGDSFTDKELDELWELYLNRFQFLGENHPMSMEDSKEDFLALFNNPSMLASLKYTDGRVDCFTYFTEDISKLYWINKLFLDRVKASAGPSETVIFFPGIVASPTAGGMNAHDVISRFASEAVAIGTSAKVLFENTNLSEQYVPTIVYRALSGMDGVSVTRPTKIDETKYRLLEVVSHED